MEKPAKLTAALFSDNGLSPKDGITSDNTLIGTGIGNQTVKFSLNGTVIGTTTATESGNWNFTPPKLPDGQHTIVVSQGGAQIAVTFTLNTTRPAVAETLASDIGASSTDRVTNNSALTGSGYAHAVVTLQEGATVIETVTANSAVLWSFDVTSLPQPLHTIVASETDLAGNTGAALLSATYDTIAPVVSEALGNDTGAFSTDEFTNDAAVTGLGDANAVVTLKEGTTVVGTATANATVVWSFAPTSLSQGQYMIITTESNDSGTQGDNIATNPTLSGTGETGRIVLLSQGSTDVTGNRTLTPAGLSQGTHTGIASETDLAGNTGSASLNFSLQGTATGSTVPAYDHIVVVMEENHAFNEIIGNLNAPYINSLTAGGALLTNYFAISHPSEPNYFALYAGSTFGITDDNQYSEPDPTLDTTLVAAGKTFTGYVETPDTSYDHNPWESFPEGFGVESDFSNFPSTNFASLPTVSFVIPNVNDDMHNGTIAQGDTWLQSHISAYAQWALSNNSLLVVTWDEDDGTQNNQVAAIFYGAQVATGSYATLYNHYDMLSTLLATSNLSGPNNAATAAPIQVFGSALCFCRNTGILTPSGERRVQELAVGDLVTTHSGAVRPIVWIGTGKVIATRGRRTAATPVIVRKNALADKVPKYDLRVTKGHSFYLDDVLIPVEFLVNHRSIEWDDRAQEVELYHIELETHDVLVANGAPAESYRDDGNRWLFLNANASWGLPPQEPCAPVLTGGPVVDAAWQRLLSRAGPRPGLRLTDEPDLHLLADGQRYDAVKRGGEAFVFRLPHTPDTLHIVSRAASQAELGLARDPRVIGIAIRRLVLWRGTHVAVADAVDPSLSDGFHDFEPDNGHRWTNGFARVPQSLLTGLRGAFELEMYVAATTKYLAEGERCDAA